jgi:hypothetical protein
MNLETGDRVAVFGAVYSIKHASHMNFADLRGTVVKVIVNRTSNSESGQKHFPCDEIHISTYHGTVIAHPKQCRKLKPKQALEFIGEWVEIENEQGHVSIVFRPVTPHAGLQQFVRKQMTLREVTAYEEEEEETT